MGFTTRSNYEAKKMFSNAFISDEDDQKKDLEISISSLVRNSKAGRIEKMARNGHKLTLFNGKIAIIDMAASAADAAKNEPAAIRANYYYYNAKNESDFKNWFDRFVKK